MSKKRVLTLSLSLSLSLVVSFFKAFIVSCIPLTEQLSTLHVRWLDIANMKMFMSAASEREIKSCSTHLTHSLSQPPAGNYFTESSVSYQLLKVQIKTTHVFHMQLHTVTHKHAEEMEL